MILKKAPKADRDYVIFYAENLRADNSLFRQQKRLIDSQLRSSKSFFSNLLGTKNFNEKAREYLKNRKLLKA